MSTAVATLGRVLFGGYFLYNALNHFQNEETMAQYAGSKRVPAPEAAVLASGGLLLLGGASVLSGYRQRTGLALLATFLLGVTPAMHRFWEVEDPQQRMGEQVDFLKNAALLGAVLLLAGRQPGRG